jgi:hypothetical protein
MSDEPIRVMTYEERQAFIVLRKALKRKPWIAKELLEGLPEEMACDLLKQVGVELKRLLEINQAFSAAAKALIKEKPSDDQVSRSPALPES